jgi:hypothetical protein
MVSIIMYVHIPPTDNIDTSLCASEIIVWHVLLSPQWGLPLMIRVEHLESQMDIENSF